MPAFNSKTCTLRMSSPPREIGRSLDCTNPVRGRKPIWPSGVLASIAPRRHRLSAVWGSTPASLPRGLYPLLEKRSRIGHKVGQFFMLATGSVLHECLHFGIPPGSGAVMRSKVMFPLLVVAGNPFFTYSYSSLNRLEFPP